MALAFKQLTTNTVAPHADAILASTAAGTKFALPVDELGWLSDKLNEGNPLLAFTRGLLQTATPLVGGSVRVQYNSYSDLWTEKKAFGAASSDYQATTYETEIFNWNVPQKAQEAILGFDLKHATPNLLVQRMNTRIIKFIQKSIQNAFAKIVATAIDAATGETKKDGKGKDLVIEHAPKDTISDVREYGLALWLKLSNVATEMVTDAEAPRDEITIIVAPVQFDVLAAAGLIGNKTSEAFAGGQYQVGVIGGYKIISGDMFIPSQVDFKQKPNADTPTKVKHDLVAIVGTSDSVLHSTSIDAANVGPIDNSNDMGTYIEVSDIAAVPARSTNLGLLKLVVARV